MLARVGRDLKFKDVAGSTKGITQRSVNYLRKRILA